MSDDWQARYQHLVQRLNADEGQGVFPMGYMAREERQSDTLKKTGVGVFGLS